MLLSFYQILHSLCFSDLDPLPSENFTDESFSGYSGEKSDFEFDSNPALESEKVEMDFVLSKQCGLGADDHSIRVILFFSCNASAFGTNLLQTHSLVQLVCQKETSDDSDQFLIIHRA